MTANVTERDGLESFAMARGHYANNPDAPAVLGSVSSGSYISPLHRQRLNGAVSQSDRIAFSLLRKLNDFLGDDFCGESRVIN